jgi:methionine synthase II (cobalamin-independent)
LQAAYAEYDAGNISKDDLENEQEAAVKDSIERGEATGAPIISDGEQRWSSFATYPIADTLAGTGLAPNLGPGGQFFAIFADGHGRQLPKLTGGPLKYNFYAADTLAKSMKYATKPMKQAVIAPSMLALLYPLKDPVEGYTREEFEQDIIDECVTDIRKAFETGAARVSIDFTEGRLATREDPRNPWTGAGLLPHFIELNNRVLENFSDEERRMIGIHTCPGGDRDSVHSADVPYNNLLPEMFKINAGYFLIQLASERDKDPVYELIAQHSRENQMCYIGVTATSNPRAESPQEICDQLVRAADFIPKERLGSTDDCGFSPFSIDEKPNHGSPDYAREVAFQKIANRVEGTRMAAEKLGVG